MLVGVDGWLELLDGGMVLVVEFRRDETTDMIVAQDNATQVKRIRKVATFERKTGVENGTLYSVM